MKRARRRSWIKAAYEEKMVSAQCSPGGGGPSAIQQAVFVPGWFVKDELGLGTNHSILDTFAGLDETNRQHRNILKHGTSEPPAHVRQRTSSAVRRRRIVKLLNSAQIG